VQPYPISLVLTDKKCLVVGGGKVAWRKAESLKNAGAVVTVIGPGICDELMAIDGIEKVPRAFAVSDLDGMFLVIGSTDSAEVNQLVAVEAQRRGILCNIVDKPPLCNFYVNANVNRGDLNISISTGGSSPALSKRIRKELDVTYGPEFEVLTRLMNEYRQKTRETVPDISVRGDLMNKLVNAGIEIIIKEAGEDAARQKIERIIADELSA
jgi:precorrin-2 dehydrogenase/sirohydrochlorin ferrochelatase